MFVLVVGAGRCLATPPPPTNEANAILAGQQERSNVVHDSFVFKKGSGGDAYEPNHLRPEEEQDILASSLKVPYHPQTAANCGWYALKMVMDYHQQKDKRNPSPPAEKGKPGDHWEPLWEYAKRTGNYMDDGGGVMFPSAIGKVAEAYGYTFQSYSYPFWPADLATLRKAVHDGKPVMVSVKNADSNGDVISNRRVGHWVVIEGFRTVNGVEYMVVKHGWSGGSRIWRVSDFSNGWNMGSAVILTPKY